MSPTSPDMRALVVRGGGVELSSLPRPAARDGHVLVRVTHALVTPFEREVVRGLHPLGTEPNTVTRILGSSFFPPSPVNNGTTGNQCLPHLSTIEQLTINTSLTFQL